MGGQKVKRLLTIIMVLAWAGIAAAQSNTTTGPLNYSKQSQGQYNAGGEETYGSVKWIALSTAAAPTVTVNGTAGSTSISYYCAAEDMNGVFGIPSAATTITNGNASLSATNNNYVFCPGQPGALGYEILKTNTSTSLGQCNANSFINASSATGTGCGITDSGQATGSWTAATINPGPQTQFAGAGTTFDFTQTTSMCSTSGVIDNTCTEPTVTLPAIFNTKGTYIVSCTCTQNVTAVPIVQHVIEGAGTSTATSTASGATSTATTAPVSPGVNVVIAALTAATASCTEVSCHVALATSTGN
jgi:hypothetical protein